MRWWEWIWFVARLLFVIGGLFTLLCIAAYFVEERRHLRRKGLR